MLCAFPKHLTSSPSLAPAHSCGLLGGVLQGDADLASSGSVQFKDPGECRSVICSQHSTVYMEVITQEMAPHAHNAHIHCHCFP